MLSVEMHTQVYREQYQDAVRAAQHDQLVRSAVQPRTGGVRHNLASWLNRRTQREQRQSSAQMCCAPVACC